MARDGDADWQRHLRVLRARVDVQLRSTASARKAAARGPSPERAGGQEGASIAKLIARFKRDSPKRRDAREPVADLFWWATPPPRAPEAAQTVECEYAVARVAKTVRNERNAALELLGPPPEPPALQEPVAPQEPTSPSAGKSCTDVLALLGPPPPMASRPHDMAPAARLDLDELIGPVPCMNSSELPTRAPALPTAQVKAKWPSTPPQRPDLDLAEQAGPAPCHDSTEVPAAPSALALPAASSALSAPTLPTALSAPVLPAAPTNKRWPSTPPPRPPSAWLEHPCKGASSLGRSSGPAAPPAASPTSRPANGVDTHKRVRVLWDIENVPVPADKTAFSVARALQVRAQRLGEALWGTGAQVTARTLAFHNPMRRTLSPACRKELVSAFVTLVDIGISKAGAADLQIMQEMESLAESNGPDQLLLVLVSNDTDFLPTVERLMRKGFKVASIRRRDRVAQPAGLPARSLFSAFAWQVLDWEAEVLAQADSRKKAAGTSNTASRTVSGAASATAAASPDAADAAADPAAATSASRVSAGMPAAALGNGGNIGGGKKNRGGKGKGKKPDRRKTAGTQTEAAETSVPEPAEAVSALELAEAGSATTRDAETDAAVRKRVESLREHLVARLCEASPPRKPPPPAAGLLARWEPAARKATGDISRQMRALERRLEQEIRHVRQLRHGS